jgi:signal transduction histidine kinase/ligand-binding sensor domain-containing protein
MFVRKKFGILLYILLVNIFILPAQDIFQKFYHLTRNSGLSQSTVNCIIKDSTGFMWFGTNDGLNRYDGYSFSYYKYDEKNESSIGLGRVLVLFVDSKGRLWAGTDQGGLNQYIPDKDDFIRIQNKSLDSNSLSNNDVRGICETKKGDLWIATNGGGLDLYNPETGTFNKLDNIINHHVNCLNYDRNGNLWVGTTSGVEILDQAYEFSDKQNKSRQLKFNGNYNILSIYQDSRGIIWFGTFGNGAISYNPESEIINYYSGNNGKDDFINHGIIRCFAEDDKKNLLIGTGGGGIDKLNPATGKVQFIQSQLYNQYSLNSDIIYDFYPDDKKNLWIGTYNGGVNIIFDAKDKFGHIKSFGNNNSLSRNSVLSIREDKNNNLWIGTDGGGLDYYNPAQNVFVHYKNDPSNPNSISGNVIKSLFLDSKNVLWIGTFNEGLNSFDTNSGRFKRYHTSINGNSISANHIWDIDEDQYGRMWFASLGGGLDCYDKKTGEFKNYHHEPGNNSSLSDNYVSSVEIDKNNNIWVGTEYGGVNKMSLNNPGIFKVYNRNDSLKGSLSSNQICTIFESSTGRIWIGTLGGGISLYKEKEDKFINYTEKDGLSNNLVYAILEEKNGILWISTNNGLSKFINASEASNHPLFQNYDVSDGLQSNEFSPQAACNSSQGLMYFGGIDGINFFSPDNLRKNNNIPPIVITDFKIFNQSVDIKKQNSPLTKPISRTKIIHLKYNQSVITFEFAALDYTMPLKNKYKYKLDGFEEGWNNVGNQRSATYTNLNPGEYTFRVIGSNNDDIWNNKGASVQIIISPPFYKTWIFRSALLILVILLVLVFYKFKLNSLEKQKGILKTMVNERTSDLLHLNNILENKNQEIESQRIELLEQKEQLILNNHELENKQTQIQLQNNELEKHRHNLEELVSQRTYELELAKRKAEESDKLKMAFLSNMSHEIRTPMNAIIGFASLLNDKEITESEHQDFIHQININSESLLVLIDDILDLSRIEANQLEIKKEVFNLYHFINDMFKHYKQTEQVIGNINFLVTLNIPENKRIYTDRHRLRQILINLLDNAFKFTSKGSIELGVEEKEGVFHIYVRDTGIGIEKESLKVIFDRFRKGNDLGDKLYRGAGLGLAISRRLAGLLGGDLKAESQAGDGSFFQLILPSDLENKTENPTGFNISRPIDAFTIDLTDRLIMIVEDEKDNFLFLNGLLKRKNAEIIWATDGKNAVEMNRIHVFDLILMDIKMPEMNGYDALKIIKSESPHIPVIAQTAFARSEEELKIRQAGFDDYISKPIKPHLLFNILAKYI